jgi:hypothetical protein
MASNLDYLSPSLLPLEEKAQAYVDAEAALQKAEIELRNQPQGAGLNQPLQPLRDARNRLHAELLGLLPTRDEWVKINLGYGPSRVGAWHVPATEGTAEHYQVRVVH